MCLEPHVGFFLSLTIIFTDTMCEYHKYTSMKRPKLSGPRCIFFLFYYINVLTVFFRFHNKLSPVDGSLRYPHHNA